LTRLCPWVLLVNMYMKIVRLLFKAGLLGVLFMVRTGEIDISPLLSLLKVKYRTATEYYIDRLADIGIFLMVLDFVQFFIIYLYKRRKKNQNDDNFTVGIRHIYSIVLSMGLILGLLSLFRIDARSLLTSISIVFAGIALLTKDYISNMITGMINTFSGEISIGDNISIGQHKGKVLDVTLQKVHLLNDDDDVIYIPNILFHTVEVVNYTKRQIKRTSVEFEIGISHLNNVEEIEKMLIETLQPFNDMIHADSYYLRVAEVRKDFVLMKFQYILKEPNKELERIIRRKTVRKIVEFISLREKIVQQRMGLLDRDEATN
jgi:small-conductance mechanosensitive channel